MATVSHQFDGPDTDIHCRSWKERVAEPTVVNTVCQNLTVSRLKGQFGAESSIMRYALQAAVILNTTPSSTSIQTENRFIPAIKRKVGGINWRDGGGYGASNRAY